MSDEIQVVLPFVGQLTGEAIRMAVQYKLEMEYFQVAHALAPEMFMRHASLSSAIATLTERSRCR